MGKGKPQLGFRGSQRPAAGELGGECEEHSPPQQQLAGPWEAILLILLQRQGPLQRPG